MGRVTRLILYPQKIYCEDMGENWSLGMLVDSAGEELAPEPDADGHVPLTRGLVAVGFYEYISQAGDHDGLGEDKKQDSARQDSTEPINAKEKPSKQDDGQKHGDPPNADTQAGGELALPAEGCASVELVLDQAAEQAAHEDDSRDVDTSTEILQQDITAEPDSFLLPDISTDTLEGSSGDSSVILVLPESVPTAAVSEGAESSTSEQAAGVSAPPVAYIGGDRALKPSHAVSAPLVAPAVQRPRQTSSTSFFGTSNKPSNPIEAYLKSSFPLASSPPEELDPREILEIEDGKWVSKIPPFRIAVTKWSQRKVAKSSGGEYTVFQIVSSVVTPPKTAVQHGSEQSNISETREATTSGAESGDPRTSGPSRATSEIRQIVVDRRYTHFQHLHTILRSSLPLITLPDLPEKRLTGNFDPSFLDTRKRDLERYLVRISRHELVRSNRAFLDFLGCENEEVYDAQVPKQLMMALRNGPERFFARVKYDEGAYFDESQLLEDVQEVHARMARHVRAVEKGQATAAIFDNLTSLRENMQTSGTTLSALATSLISLSSGLAQPKEAAPASSSSNSTDRHTASSEAVNATRRRRDRAKAHNLQNDQGAFCWHETCSKCLATTKAVQDAAEALAVVGNLYDANARRILLTPQEQLLEYSLPRQRYQTLLSNTDLAQKHLARLLEVEDDEAEAEKEERLNDRKRTEVVLNTVLAEMEKVHTERREDLQHLTTTLLNGQIAFHEHVLAKLRAARDAFEPEKLEEAAETGPRLPSILEKSVMNPPPPPAPLPKPSSYGLPAAAMAIGMKPISSILSTLMAGATGLPGGLSGSWRSAFSAIRAQPAPSGRDGTEQVAKSLTSPSLASSSRFVFLLDWTMNSRGEQRKYA